MINDPAIKLDLLIRSCSGPAQKSIEWCVLNDDPQVGLAEALSTLANDFGNALSLTRVFMKDILGSNDKGRVRETVSNIRTFKVGLENFYGHSGARG